MLWPYCILILYSSAEGLPRRGSGMRFTDQCQLSPKKFSSFFFFNFHFISFNFSFSIFLLLVHPRGMNRCLKYPGILPSSTEGKKMKNTWNESKLTLDMLRVGGIKGGRYPWQLQRTSYTLSFLPLLSGGGKTTTKDAYTLPHQYWISPS